MTKVNNGLIAKVSKKLERMSEVVICCLGQTSEDIHCCI